MPRSAGQTVPVTPSEAVAHKDQAEEYLRAARYSLSCGDFNAAAGTAVDAGINAADAVAGMNMGQRWKGAHEQAADFAAKAGSEGKKVARELRRLLPLKTQAHYEPATVSKTKAGSRGGCGARGGSRPASGRARRVSRRRHRMIRMARQRAPARRTAP